MANYQNFRLSALYAKGALADVEALLKGNLDWRKARPSIYPNALKGMSWKGKLLGVPTHKGGQLLYYSPALLQRAGLAAPPRNWNWDTFVEYGRKDSSVPDVWGYISSWQYPDIGNLALNNGGRLVSEDVTKYTLTSPEVIETLEWMNSLVRTALMMPHDGSSGGGFTDLITQGKTVFQPAISLRMSTWRKTGGISFATGFNPLGPRNRTRQNYSHGSAHGFGVFKNDKDQRKSEAAAFASLWVSRVDSGMTIAEHDMQTPYKYIIEDPQFQAKLKADKDLWPFYEIMPNVLPFANGPTSTEERAAIEEQTKAIWAGKTTVRAAMVEARRVAQGLLDESLR
jgi:ABC-type glycerol-3-phosphate transport system substrate-binding protein